MRTCDRMARACTSNSRPASVSASGRARLSNKAMPTSDSSWRICIETAGCVSSSNSAAREKLAQAAVASKMRRDRRVRFFMERRAAPGRRLLHGGRQNIRISRHHGEPPAGLPRGIAIAAVHTKMGAREYPVIADRLGGPGAGSPGIDGIREVESPRTKVFLIRAISGSALRRGHTLSRIAAIPPRPLDDRPCPLSALERFPSRCPRRAQRAPLPFQPARLGSAHHQLRWRQHVRQDPADRPAHRRQGGGAVGQGLGGRPRVDEARRLLDALHGQAACTAAPVSRPGAGRRDGGLPAALHLQPQHPRRIDRHAAALVAAVCARGPHAPRRRHRDRGDGAVARDHAARLRRHGRLAAVAAPRLRAGPATGAVRPRASRPARHHPRRPRLVQLG